MPLLNLRRRLAPVLAAAFLLSGCFVAEPPADTKASARSSRSSEKNARSEHTPRSERSSKKADHRSTESTSSRSGKNRGDVRWSETDPPINLTHLFEGQINKRGKPVGFHARPAGVDPERARMVRVVDGPNRAGVYIAKVEIRAASGGWLGKTSTLYPDEMSEEDVVAAILAAYEHASGGEKWRGDSGHGFTIEGYFQDGRINTAYPIFRRSEGR